MKIGYRMAVTGVSGVLLAALGFGAGYVRGYDSGSEQRVLVAHRSLHRGSIRIDAVGKAQTASTGTIVVNAAPEHWSVTSATERK